MQCKLESSTEGKHCGRNPFTKGTFFYSGRRKSKLASMEKEEVVCTESARNEIFVQKLNLDIFLMEL